MKSFKTFLIEEILRRPDKETMTALSNSGAFTPSEGNHIELTLYHGGHFGEAEGETPHRDMITFPETSDRWSSIKPDSPISFTPNQPVSSGLGLSTTPDAIAAREYRGRRFGAPLKDHREPHFNDPMLGKLYEMKVRIRPERFKQFRNLGEMERYIHDNTHKHPDFKEWSKNYSHLTTHGQQRKYLTDVHGIDAFGIGEGTGHARSSGEVLLLNRDNIHSIVDRTSEVDAVRTRMSKARRAADNIPVVQKVDKLNKDIDDISLDSMERLRGLSQGDKGWSDAWAYSKDAYAKIRKMKENPLLVGLEALRIRNKQNPRSNRPEFRNRRSFGI
jgi:hypothetical protein